MQRRSGCRHQGRNFMEAMKDMAAVSPHFGLGLSKNNVTHCSYNAMLILLMQWPKKC